MPVCFNLNPVQKAKSISLYKNALSSFNLEMTGRDCEEQITQLWALGHSFVYRAFRLINEMNGKKQTLKMLEEYVQEFLIEFAESVENMKD